jgi:hypothetical protein
MGNMQQSEVFVFLDNLNTRTCVQVCAMVFRVDVVEVCAPAHRSRHVPCSLIQVTVQSCQLPFTHWQLQPICSEIAAVQQTTTTAYVQQVDPIVSYISSA